LGVRPRSIDETRRRMRQLGYRQELVEVVIELLIKLGYLDDAEFARVWVESRDRARPRGAIALRRELALKGVDRAIVDAVLEERESGGTGAWDAATTGESPTPDEAAADRLLARKATTLARESDPRQRHQKAYALLARHGFSPDVISAALSREGASESTED
ncbi:MAG: regulatory protein RecX, partial [Candidatus Limnocylindrales bacterium]